MARWMCLLVAVSYAATMGAALAEECDVLIADMIEATGATFERKTELGHYHLRHPLAASLVVSCGTLPLGVSVAFDEPYPPSGFFDLVGRAGSVLTGETKAILTKTARECYRTALTESWGLAEASSPKAEIECGDPVINVFRPQRSKSP